MLLSFHTALIQSNDGTAESVGSDEVMWTLSALVGILALLLLGVVIGLVVTRYKVMKKKKETECTSTRLAC